MLLIKIRKCYQDLVQKRNYWISCNSKLGIGQRKYNMYRNKIFHLCHKNDNESILIIQGILAYIKGVDQDRYSKLKNTMML